jgi:hypothetical protein
MKSLVFIILIFLLAACNTAATNGSGPSTTETASLSKLPDLGEAPELSNEIWLNTPEPLQLANLQGQVILLEMWTFG